MLRLDPKFAEWMVSGKIGTPSKRVEYADEDEDDDDDDIPGVKFGGRRW